MNETPEQKAQRLGVPLIPKRAPILPHPLYDTVSVCGECGREMKMIENFVCSRTNCPTGLGSIWS